MADTESFEEQDYQRVPHVVSYGTNTNDSYYLDLYGNYMPINGMVPPETNGHQTYVIPWNIDYIRSSFYDGLIEPKYAYKTFDMAQNEYLANQFNIKTSEGIHNSGQNPEPIRQDEANKKNNYQSNDTKGNAKQSPKGDSGLVNENYPLYLDSISANYINEEYNEMEIPLDATVYHEIQGNFSMDTKDGNELNDIAFPYSNTCGGLDKDETLVPLTTFKINEPEGYDEQNSVYAKECTQTSVIDASSIIKNHEDTTLQTRETSCASTPKMDTCNQTFADNQYSNMNQVPKTLNSNWLGQSYYNNYDMMNIISENPNLGMVHNTGTWTFGDSYFPYIQENMYSFNTSTHKGYNNGLDVSGEYAKSPIPSNLENTNKSSAEKEAFEYLEHYPNGHDNQKQHFYNATKGMEYQNNSSAEHSEYSGMHTSGKTYNYTKHGVNKMLDETNINNVNLQDVDFINMSDKTWLTLRGAGMFKLGNKGRAVLKSKISKQLKGNTQMRVRAGQISGVRRATTRQLFQLAQVCGIKSHFK
ncbi:hypothetical protein BdWA1_000233 [Babesia duncani]|uniref:Uncharacterized protein n=1 Tax=Babesia duncani TaxID=323732 RepID=A0AAD9PLU7_9APIC|nr:hypothetical protein BdWA1_000233 [Babesia duncani]